MHGKAVNNEPLPARLGALGVPIRLRLRPAARRWPGVWSRARLVLPLLLPVLPLPLLLLLLLALLVVGSRRFRGPAGLSQALVPVVPEEGRKVRHCLGE